MSNLVALHWPWWILLALALGLVVGWFTSRTVDSSESRFPGWLKASAPLFLIGLVVALLDVLPAQLEAWLQSALLLFACYAIGCFVASWLRGLFDSGELEHRPVTRHTPAAEATTSTAATAASAEPEPAPKPVAEPEPTPEPESDAETSGTTREADSEPDTPSESYTESTSTSKVSDDDTWEQESASESDTAPKSESSPDWESTSGSESGADADSGSTGAAAASRSSMAAASGAGVGVQPAGLDSPRGKPDNLKRISGIGPKNESILNELGIFHFSQIAKWTQQEVDWVNDHLDFVGRIEREEWVEQASTLAQGGQTDFSNRQD